MGSKYTLSRAVFSPCCSTDPFIDHTPPLTLALILNSSDNESSAAPQDNGKGEGKGRGKGNGKGRGKGSGKGKGKGKGKGTDVRRRPAAEPLTTGRWRVFNVEVTSSKDPGPVSCLRECCADLNWYIRRPCWAELACLGPASAVNGSHSYRKVFRTGQNHAPK